MFVFVKNIKKHLAPFSYFSFADNILDSEMRQHPVNTCKVVIYKRDVVILWFVRTLFSSFLNPNS